MPDTIEPIPSNDDIQLYDEYLATQPGAQEVKKSEEAGWLDVPKQLGIGAYLGALNTIDSPFAILRTMFGELEGEESSLILDEDGRLIKQKTGEFDKSFDKPKTITGGLVRGISQFAVGAAVPFGVASKATGLTASIAKGAAADFLAFGAHEERLSNVLAEYDVPVLSTVAEYLKAEGTDSDVIGRLKNVLEGGALGLGLEAGLKLIGGVAKLRRAKALTTEDPDKARSLLTEATQDLGSVKNMVEAPTKPIQATVKDRIVAKTLEIDPGLTHDEASALADVQISLARYVNPAADADVTLAGLMDVRKVRAEDIALRQQTARLIGQDPSLTEEAAYEIVKSQAMSVKPVLKAGPKGKTTFATNGKALVELFDKADLSTHLHETAHVFRRYLRPDDKATFEKWLGVKDGKAWSRSAEERFAVGFEEYMRQGVAPTPELKGAFDRIKAVVVDIYKKIRGHGKGLARLSPEIKQAYDRLLSNTEREGIFDTRVNMAAKQLSNDLGITVRPTHVRALEEAVKKGGKIDPKVLEIPHFTRILRAAHDSQGTTELAQQVFKEVNDLNPTGVETLIDTARVAQSVGQDKDVLVNTMKSFVQNSKQLPAMLAAYDWHVQTLTAEVAKIAEQVKGYGVSELPERLSAQFLQRHSELTQLVELQIHGQTAIGRSLGAYRLRGQPIDAVAKLFQDGDKQIDELFQTEGAKASDLVGGQGKVRELAQKVLDAKGADDAAKRMKEAGDTMHKKMNLVMEWYMNAILSGPKTHMVNLVSNTVMSVMLPIERMVGGKVLAAFGNKAAAIEAKKGLSQLTGLQLALRESLQASKESWSSGTSFMDKASAMDITKGTQSKFLKSYVYLASRALQAEDSFFKVLNFRAHAYAELVEKASKEANPEALIKSEMDKMMKDPLAYGSSASAAKSATFTHDLKAGSSFHSLSSFVNRHPWARLIIPFVKTPSNILLEFGRHVPGLPLLRKGIREAITGKLGAEAQASFVGKQIIGFGLATSAAGLYASGLLTGSGPTDPEERKAWLAAGKREYAINIGGRWFDYKRMDPWATLIGTMADTSKACAEIGKPGEAVNIMFKGIKQGVVDKTYFKGISDLVKAMDNPEVWGVMWAANMGSGMLPYSGAMSQASRAITSHSYRMQGFLDAFKAKSLGLWEPEKRYDLYGNPIDPGIDEAISPIASTGELESPALQELAKIKGGIDMEPPKVIGNVQLTKEQREYISEQTGKVKVGGKTLMERLEAIVASEAYQRLPENDLTPDDYTKVPRAMALKRPYDAAQDAAIRLAKEKFPELKQAIQQDRKNKALSRIGDFERIQEISR